MMFSPSHTQQVMRFAEMTQEVQITRPTPRKLDIGFTPGRRKANQVFKLALDNLEEMGHVNARSLEVDLGLVYSLGPKFPHMKLNTPESEEFVRSLVDFLEKRIQKRHILTNDLSARGECYFSLAEQLYLILFLFPSHREQLSNATRGIGKAAVDDHHG